MFQGNGLRKCIGENKWFLVLVFLITRGTLSSVIHSNNGKDSGVVPSRSFQEAIFRSPAGSCSWKGCPSWKIKGSSSAIYAIQGVGSFPSHHSLVQVGMPLLIVHKMCRFPTWIRSWTEAIIRISSEWPPFRMQQTDHCFNLTVTEKNFLIHKWKFHVSLLLTILWHVEF